jgi:hypothetical protein
MTYFYAKRPPSLYVGDGYWYDGGPSDFDLYDQTNTKVSWLNVHYADLTNFLGWLNGACNNL